MTQMICPRCQGERLELITEAQRSATARIGGIVLLLGGLGLILYALRIVINIRSPGQDSMGILTLWVDLFALVLFSVAVLMLAGSWGLLMRKSEAKGPRRCPGCGTVYEPGAHGTLMPLG